MYVLIVNSLLLKNEMVSKRLVIKYRNFRFCHKMSLAVKPFKIIFNGFLIPSSRTVTRTAIGVEIAVWLLIVRQGGVSRLNGVFFLVLKSCVRHVGEVLFFL